MDNSALKVNISIAILQTLKDGDKYGYEIIQDIKNKINIEIKQPSLYSCLKRLEKQNYLSSYWRDSAIGGKRHYYSINNNGKIFLEKNKNNLYYSNDSSINTKNDNNNISNNPDIFLQQENIFNLSKKNKKNNQNLKNESKYLNNIEDIQFNLFKEVDALNDDGKIITERIENFEDSKKFEPTPLNITPKDSSYLIKKSNKNKIDNNQQKIADLYSKSFPYDPEKSIKKIQEKLNNYEKEKKNKNNISNSSVINKQQTNKQSKDISFNNYKALKKYYLDKQIEFTSHTPKIIKQNLINIKLINLISSSLFLLLSITLSLIFHFSINIKSNLNLAYLIFPFIVFIYFIYNLIIYLKSKNNLLLKQKNNEIYPLILPLITLVIILFIIGMNLIFGFRAYNFIYYFPVLMYPIILTFYLNIIPLTNRLISKIIKK